MVGSFSEREVVWFLEDRGTQWVRSGNLASGDCPVGRRGTNSGVGPSGCWLMSIRYQLNTGGRGRSARIGASCCGGGRKRISSRATAIPFPLIDAAICLAASRSRSGRLDRGWWSLALAYLVHIAIRLIAQGMVRRGGLATYLLFVKRRPASGLHSQCRELGLGSSEWRTRWQARVVSRQAGHGRYGVLGRNQLRGCQWLKIADVQGLGWPLETKETKRLVMT